MSAWLIPLVPLLAFAVSAAITGLSIAVSHRLNLLDRPDPRKVHRTPTPRLGGVGIVLATALVAVPAFALLVDSSAAQPWETTKHHLSILVGALFVFVAGVADDVWSVSSRIKLMTLVASAAVFCGSGAALESLIYADRSLIAFPWLSWLVTTLWIVGMAVAFNFIDGLDGLAGGLALLACVVLAYFLLVANLFAAAVAPLALAGALVGFLCFNVPPARTFMGDGGSLTIGFLLGALTINANPELGTMRAMVVPALALSVALVDTAFTLFRRRYEQRRSMFSAERGHIHHGLLDRGFSTKQTVLLIHAVSVTAVAIGVFSLNFDGLATFGGLALVAPVLWSLFHAAGSGRTGLMLKALRKKREIDRASRRFRGSFETSQLEFDETTTFSEWWGAVCNAAERLQFARIDLPITAPGDGQPRTFRWVNEGDELIGAGPRIDARIPLPPMGVSAESATAEVSVPVGDSLESAGERLALFSRLIAENGQRALRRIHRADAPSSHAVASVPPGEFGHLRVAVVHDFFYTYAGAERVVEQLLRVLPHADVFGLFDFVPDEERGFLRGKPVTTTFLQRMPLVRSKHRAYLPLMPLAIEQLDVSAYDLVVSSSYLVAKGVITGPDQLHVCYCHSPVRYGWDLQHQYLRDAGLGYGPRGMFARTILHYLRTWDARSSLGVDHFLANSQFVARRIAKVYRRDAEVVYPPVDTEAFVPLETREDYYVTASRLVGYKRIDLIVEAFTQSPGRKLVVVGDGPEMQRLRSIAGPNVEFDGQADKPALVARLQEAQAFVFAAEEDFGIAPVEALACGTPVIAYGKGGVTESVPAGKMGTFFAEQSVESLLDALDRFERQTIEDDDRLAARRRAEEFSVEQFVERLTESLREACAGKWPDGGSDQQAVTPKQVLAPQS
ncbi:MAG: glycosyltransferase [Lacipirellulaceae bacterium]